MARLAGGMVGLTLLYPRQHPDSLLLFQLALDQLRAEGCAIPSARLDSGGARLRVTQAIIDWALHPEPVPLQGLHGLWRPHRPDDRHPDVTGLHLARAVARHRSALVLTLSPRDMRDRDQARQALIERARVLALTWEPAETVAAAILHPDMRLLSLRELADPALDPPLHAPAGSALKDGFDRARAAFSPDMVTPRPHRAPPQALAVPPVQRPHAARPRLALRSAGRLMRAQPSALAPPLPLLDAPARRVTLALRSRAQAMPPPRPRALIHGARLAVVALWLVLWPLSVQMLGALGQSG